MKIFLDLSYPGKLKKGDKGASVKFLQELLSLQGVSLSLDGDFGDATAFALQEFQRVNFTTVKVYKTLTQRVWDALIYPFAVALRSVKTKKTAPEALALSYADRQLYLKARELNGQNLGPWVRLYMKGKEGTDFPWCMGFVQFCMRKAFDDLKKEPILPDTFSCDVVGKFAREKGLLVTNPEEIKKGAIFLIRKTKNDWIHTGFVLKQEKDVIVTIEGNTNEAGYREGIEVRKRIRKLTNKIDIINQYSL